jgi:hypothetical protein
MLYVFAGAPESFTDTLIGLEEPRFLEYSTTN